MCDICVAHGGGKKWFEVKRHLDAQYARELGFEPWEKDHWKNLETVYAELAGQIGDVMNDPTQAKTVITMIENIINDIHPLTQGVTFTFPQGHGGQILTLQEVEGVIKLSGEPYLVECPCRKMIANDDDRCCIPLGLHGETADTFPSKTTKVEKIDVDEAIALVRQFNAEGRVHQLAGTPLPIGFGLCNCEYPNCIALRPRIDFGVKHLKKSHYIAKVDFDKCSGCKECLSRCSFGAVSYINATGRAQIDMWKCFGCGLCVETCPEKAIELISRESVPALKDEW